MLESRPTIEQFRKELLLIKIIYIKLFTFVTNEAKCKAAGYDYYNNYKDTKLDGYTEYVYNIGYHIYNIDKNDYMRIVISKHSRKIYNIRANFFGGIFERFLQCALKHYNKVVAKEILDKSSDIHWQILNDRYFINSAFITFSENQAHDFDPLSTINDMKLSFAYTYLYPDAGIGLYKNKSDMSSLTVERLSLFNNLLDDLIKGVKNNTYIT